MVRAQRSQRTLRVALVAAVVMLAGSRGASAENCANGQAPAGTCPPTQTAVSLAPAERYEERARALLVAGDLDGAEREATTALYHAPTAARLWYRRALIRMARRQFITAAADLNVALRNDPAMAAAYVARGDCYRALGALDLAVADTTRALELEPNSAEALAARAYALLRQGKSEDARGDAERSVSLDPKLARGYLTRGLAIDQKAGGRERERVVADLSKALELDPSLREIAVLKPVLQRYGL